MNKEYNLDTSAGHPKPIEIDLSKCSTLPEFNELFKRVNLQTLYNFLVYGEVIYHILDDDIVRYSSETRRVNDKEH